MMEFYSVIGQAKPSSVNSQNIFFRPGPSYFLSGSPETFNQNVMDPADVLPSAHLLKTKSTIESMERI